MYTVVNCEPNHISYFGKYQYKYQNNLFSFETHLNCRFSNNSDFDQNILALDIKIAFNSVKWTHILSALDSWEVPIILDAGVQVLLRRQKGVYRNHTLSHRRAGCADHRRRLSRICRRAAVVKYYLQQHDEDRSTRGCGAHWLC